MSTRKHPATTFLSCFNGAAPARARNGCSGRPLGERTRCASTGPRPRGRGMATLVHGDGRPSPGLQRGRARAGAECNRPCVGRSCLHPASTGPRPRGRGMAAQAADLSEAARGFNGAAPARARNAWPTTLAGGTSCVLQRGRARAGAECSTTTGTYNTAIGASTGPRPRGRGMVAGRDWLQSHEPASTGPRPRGRGMRALGDGVPVFHHASTGPRPRGRGMAEEIIKSGALTGGFNGAAPARARNGGVQDVGLPGHRNCFNGAAPARARNARGRCGIRRSKELLQRGRARAGAE